MQNTNIMLIDNISDLIQQARKANDMVRVETLRSIKAKLLNEQKEPTPYTEASELKVIMKLIAAHKDSIAQFAAGNREDLVKAEQAELAIIEEFAPKEASEEEIVNYTEMLINLRKHDVGSVSMKDMKDILFGVKEKYPTADGKLVSKVLKLHL